MVDFDRRGAWVAQRQLGGRRRHEVAGQRGLGGRGTACPCRRRGHRRREGSGRRAARGARTAGPVGGGAGGGRRRPGERRARRPAGSSRTPRHSPRGAPRSAALRSSRWGCAASGRSIVAVAVMSAVLDAVADQVAVIAVGYADAGALDPPALDAGLAARCRESGLGSPAPSSTRSSRTDAACTGGCRRRTLPSWSRARGRRAGAFGVAGQLRLGELGRVAADVVGVRSAVCRDGDRDRGARRRPGGGRGRRATADGAGVTYLSTARRTPALAAGDAGAGPAPGARTTTVMPVRRTASGRYASTARPPPRPGAPRARRRSGARSARPPTASAPPRPRPASAAPPPRRRSRRRRTPPASRSSPPRTRVSRGGRRTPRRPTERQPGGARGRRAAARRRAAERAAAPS